MTAAQKKFAPKLSIPIPERGQGRRFDAVYRGALYAMVSDYLVHLIDKDGAPLTDNDGRITDDDGRPVLFERPPAYMRPRAVHNRSSYTPPRSRHKVPTFVEAGERLRPYGAVDAVWGKFGDGPPKGIRVDALQHWLVRFAAAWEGNLDPLEAINGLSEYITIACINIVEGDGLLPESVGTIYMMENMILRLRISWMGHLALHPALRKVE